MEQDEAHTTQVKQMPDWAEHSASVYQPLNIPGKEIRLMHIEASDDYNAEVHVRLSIAKLECNPEFYAVSLTWGNPSLTRKIYLEGHEYLVTVNQRPTYQAAPLWMDVVCINQTDRPERQLMVGMMEEIYRASIRTLVWLAEPACLWYESLSEKVMVAMTRRLNHDGTFESCASRVTADSESFSQACQVDWIDGALWILRKISENAHFWELPFFFNDESNEYGKYKYSRQWKVAIKTLEILVCLPYWSRVWIIQELVLSPQDPEVHLGMRTLPFSLFSAAALNFYEHFGGCCKMLFPYWMVSDLSSALTSIEVLGKYKREYSNGPMNPWLSVRWTRYCFATDPRDFVYGTSGLARRDARIAVDYSLTTFQVFAKFQWFAIQHVGTISDIWDGAKTLGHTAGKPSWVVDWSNETGRQLSSIRKNWDTLACRPPVDARYFSFEPEACLLHLPARRIDTVRQVRYGGYFPRIWTQSGHFGCPELLQTEENFQGLLRDSKMQISTGKYWEVLMAGRFKQGGRGINSEADRSFYSFCQPFNPEQCTTMEFVLDFCRNAGDVRSLTKDVYSVLAQLIWSLSHSSFFITEAGRIGSGEQEVQAGDEIFELYGCDLPMVLRGWRAEDSGGVAEGSCQREQKRLDRTASEPVSRDVCVNHYTVVGACYLSDSMDCPFDYPGFYDRAVTLH